MRTEGLDGRRDGRAVPARPAKDPTETEKEHTSSLAHYRGSEDPHERVSLERAESALLVGRGYSDTLDARFRVKLSGATPVFVNTVTTRCCDPLRSTSSQKDSVPWRHWLGTRSLVWEILSRRTTHTSSSPPLEDKLRAQQSVGLQARESRRIIAESCTCA